LVLLSASTVFGSGFTLTAYVFQIQVRAWIEQSGEG
jgi:hypothetical protein